MMMRPTGCCTWIFGGEDLAAIAERCRLAGVDGVELHGDVPQKGVSRQGGPIRSKAHRGGSKEIVAVQSVGGVDPEQAGRIFRDAGLAIFSITPGDADISHPDPAVRQAGLAYYDSLIEWAQRLGHGAVRVSVHGQVQRIRPVSTQAQEDALLVDSIRRICATAQAAGLPVVFEILNRYETHQVHTIGQGLKLLGETGAPNLQLLPDAYHMNIEETDPAAALLAAGSHIGLYHAADSHRGAAGEGHIDFAAQISALNRIGYDGPIILEPAAAGPDPFNTDKGEGFRDELQQILARSVTALQGLQLESGGVSPLG